MLGSSVCTLHSTACVLSQNSEGNVRCLERDHQGLIMLLLQPTAHIAVQKQPTDDEWYNSIGLTVK